MPVTVSETAAQFVASVYDQVRENETEAQINISKVTARVPEETIQLLDYVGGKLRLSRSALAAELLSRAVQEAALIVGLPDDEEQEVA